MRTRNERRERRRELWRELWAMAGILGLFILSFVGGMAFMGAVAAW